MILLPRIVRAQRRSRLLPFAAVCLLLCLTACTSTRPKLHVQAPQLAQAPILLLPVDVVLSELLATGLAETRADWSEQARDGLTAALGSELGRAGASVLALQADPTAELAQVELLYQAVASSIIAAELRPELLPTKRDRFDWTLGPGAAQVLRGAAQRQFPDSPPARYALFCYVRDSYASSGRKALMVVGPLLGLGVQGGQQIGVSALVDLREGRIAWFNLLLSSSGDLRSPEPAREVTRRLLEGLPGVGAS
ncbi:MAG: hypothetical protein R3F15_06770 [Lysobacterales bacterium]